MTLMQANFTRCGQPIPMRIDKYDYIFTENQFGDFVCDVVSDEHVKHMIDTGNFSGYDIEAARERFRQSERKRMAAAEATSADDKIKGRK